MAEIRAKHAVDQVPSIPKLTLLSIQHVLAFYAGAVVVPLVIAGTLHLDAETTIHLINADLFTCGIATIIQSVGFWKIGVKLPIIQGVTTTAISPIIAIGLAVTGPEGGVEGLPYIYGAIIVSGLFTFIAAPFFAKIIRFFPPLVIGTVLTTMGITLLSVSAADFIGRPEDPKEIDPHAIILGFITLGIIVLIQRIFKGFMSTIAVLLGLILGTLIGLLYGFNNFGSVAQADWIGVTTPFYFGWPAFSLTGCLSMIIVMIITMVETTGDVFAAGEIVGKRITKNHIAAALRADGLSTLLGGILNSFPYTCFAQNVGLVRLTRVKSRWVVAAAGVLMIILGVIPKAGAIVASIPQPVLGGASLALFANVALVGIQTLKKVDLTDNRNTVTLTTALGLAMLVSFQPNLAEQFPSWAEIFFASGVTVGSLTAIILNFVFFHIGPKETPDVATVEGAPVSLATVNSMTKEEFVTTFSTLFNGQRWPLERAYPRRPFGDTGELKEALQDAVWTAGEEEKLQLIRSYPDIMDMLIMPEDQAKLISQDVGSLALEDIDEAELEQLKELSAQYRQKFNLPFVAYLSRVGSIEKILHVGALRLENSPTREIVQCMDEITDVAGDRFDIMLADANPIRNAWARKFESLDF